MPRSSRLDALLVAALLVPYLWLVRAYWFVCDDAYITFRYSRNWALGHGPRFNLGPEVPVEGYSNFLWMTLAAICERVGLDPAVVTPTISAACGAVLIAWVYDTLRRHVEADPWLAAASASILALYPPFAVWGTSGLATMPAALFLFGTWVTLSLDDDDHAGLRAGLLGLALALVRTEGIAWVAVVAVLALVHRWLDKRPILPVLLPYAVVVGFGYGLYFLWRFTYYRSMVANTAHAKVHLQAATLVRGVQYVMLWITTVLSPLALLATIPAGLLGRHRTIALTAGALAVGVPAYAVAVSGDYMTWFRILVPGAAFFAVSVGIGLQTWSARHAGPVFAPAAVALGLAVLGHLPAHDVFLVPQETREVYSVRDKLGFFRTENEQWRSMKDHTDAWRAKGLALGAYAQPGDTYVAAAIGNLGYWSGVYIYDRNGLVNREVALLPWDGELRSPGHDKVVDRDFFLPRRPSILDSKYVTAPAVKMKVNYALREMGAFRVRKRYYPEIFTVLDEGAGGSRQFLVALRRGATPGEVRDGWDRFQQDFEGL